MRVTAVRISVCIIAESPLAYEYIKDAITPHLDLRVIALDEIDRAARRAVAIVFVVDRHGLQVPLCECVRRLRLLCCNGRFLVLDDDFGKEPDRRLLYSGIQGVMIYSDLRTQVADAVRRIQSGGTWVAAGLLVGIAKRGCAVRTQNPATTT